MNRDYSYAMPSSPSFVHVSPEKPDTIDYLQPICLLCLRPGEIEVARVDGFLTYAHSDCVTQEVDAGSSV